MAELKTHSSERLKKEPIPIGSMNETFIEYYRKQMVPAQLTNEEFEQMISTFKTPLPSVFRVTSNLIQSEMEEHFDELRKNGVDVIKLDVFPEEYGKIYKLSLEKALLRRDQKYQEFRKWLQLQTKLGQCHRQEFVSMITPYFANIEKGNIVLDTCASPGSKTSQVLTMLNSTGLVIANDSDIRRCQPLVHQLQRIGTMNAMITCQNAQSINMHGMKFDRVLCDVPCTGDGTIRKNGSAGYNWSPKGGCAEHGLQRKILRRGLELLNVGGICVYSTCSLNPIENEAVVNSILLETKGAVEIIDTKDMFPKLTRHHGLTNWTVFDLGNSDLSVIYNSPTDVPNQRKQFAHPTMFPQPQVEGLSNCMRFYPHDYDSGGFFVAVLKKVKEIEEVENITKPLKPLREAPYYQLNKVSPNIAQEIQETFGLKDFPLDQLYIRDQKAVHNIYLLCKPLSDLINQHGSEVFRAVNCGTPIFTNISTSKSEKIMVYPCNEGLIYFMKYATKRIYDVTPKDMKLMLEVGHSIKYSELESSIEPVESMGCVFQISGTKFIYGGMTFSSTISLFLRKDLLQVEHDKLLLAYPSLN